MSPLPTLEWWPLDRLLIHEEIDGGHVDHLASEIRRLGRFHEPIWVARGSGVILNGHHRFAALKRLDARWVPAWTFDYLDDRSITVGRWGSSEPIEKSEVIRRALARAPFPPKTTRHRLQVTLPAHSVPLSDLLGPGRPKDAELTAEAMPEATR